MDPVNAIGSIFTTPQPAAKESEVSKSSNAFGDIIKDMIRETDTDQKQADMAVEDMQAGKSKHLHEVMISVEEAEISLKMLVQMRNKALSAYEEIMRMQV